MVRDVPAEGEHHPLAGDDLERHYVEAERDLRILGALQLASEATTRIAELEAASLRLQDALQQTPGLLDVTSDYDASTPSINVLYELDLAPNVLANAL